MSLDQLLYKIRKADAEDGLMLDAVSMVDIYGLADEILVFDALVSSYAKLERKMNILKTVMERKEGDVKPVAMQLSEPFKQGGVAQVAAVFELSDGQTVSIFFHNPDVDPKRITANDELVSWRWMLNKRDITLVVAPERGKDLNINVVAQRVMKLAEKNSAAFARANVRRAENLAAIEALKVEIPALERQLARLKDELELARIDEEDRIARYQAQEAMPESINPTRRYVNVKSELLKLGWTVSQDGTTLLNSAGNVAVKQELTGVVYRDWFIYTLKNGKLQRKKHVKDMSKGTKNPPKDMAKMIDAAAKKILN